MIVSADHLRAATGDYVTPAVEFYRYVHAEWAERVVGYSTAIVMVGAPGAGKSTWLKQYARDDVAHIEAVHANPKTRRMAIEAAEKAGASVSIVCCNPPLEECLRRNAMRHGFFRVDESIVIQLWRQLQQNLPTGRVLFV